MRSSRTATPLVMPILSPGRHRTPKQGACFMEFASYLAGEKWSDHPACTHPVLAALARDVNDLSSPSRRAALTAHIHRVVGLNSDDPMVSASIAVRAAAAALPIASLDRQRAVAVGMLAALDGVDSPELNAIAAEAFQSAPGEEKWARAYRSSLARREFTPRIAVSIVHTAVVGIALACVADPDARLTGLLLDVIEETERLTRADSRASAERDRALHREFAEV